MLYNEGKIFQGGWNFGPLDTSNHTVSELIDDVVKYDDGVNCTIIDNNEKQEANLLKLDISKAVSLLEWVPVLGFEETIKYTVVGYLSDLANDSAKDNRLRTINSYSKTAQIKKIPWALD